jgi:hypothetical protein
MSPEMQSRIAVLRAASLQRDLTREEQLEAITALRGDRVGAQIASTKSRSAKAKAPPPNAADLLNELGDL